MNHLEKYLDRIIDPQSNRQGIGPVPSKPFMPPVEATPVSVEPDGESNEDNAPDILGAMKRRWYIILLIFVLLAPVAVFGVWY